MNDFVELDELWAKRHEPDAIASLEARLGEDMTTEYSHLWRHARISHFRGLQCDDSADRQQAHEYFLRGAQAAQAAMQQEAFGIEGCYWRGVNEAEAARRGNAFAALLALRNATALIERAAKRDEAYHWAGPLRELGRLIHRKPLLLGGSANVAIEYFKRALQIAPHNSTTQIHYVEALLTEQQKPEARRILHEILENPDDQTWLWEQARDRKRAEELLRAL